jgi:hypothetical protein
MSRSSYCPWTGYICFLTLLSLLLHPSSATFFDKPSVRWTYRLPGSGTLSGRGLRKDNEVAVSKNGRMVVVTADDGSLHFIFPEKLRDSFVYEPETVDGTYTESRSGLTLVEDENGQLDYVVYAVIDVPVKAGVLYDGVSVDNSRTSTLSRLLAVNLDGSLKWSIPFNGVIVGKAIVGVEKLYVVHNVPNFVGDSPTRGKISVVLLRGQQPVVTAAVSPVNRQGPFGPPVGTTVDIDGNERDVIVLAESWSNGYTANGHVYMFMPSSLYDVSLDAL